MLSLVHTAGMQDRDGGILLMSLMFGLFPFLLKLYADSGYQGKIPRRHEACLRSDQCRDRRAPRRGKFVVLPKRLDHRTHHSRAHGAAGWRKTGNVSIETVSRFLRWASVRRLVEGFVTV